MLGSVLWPARRIEAWLDANYPDHAVDDHDYSLRKDLLVSGWFGLLWSARSAVLYGVTATVLWATTILSAFRESGYPLDGTDMKAPTLSNLFGIVTLTAVLAGVAFHYFINWIMKDAVEDFNTAATSTFELYDHHDVDAVEGGEASGA